MEIVMVVAPMSRTNLKLAAQIGVSGVVGRYPGSRRGEMLRLRDRVAQHGLALSVIEGYYRHGDIVRGGPQRDQEIAGIRRLIENMEAAQVPILCYNFMPNEDWLRTSIDVPERGGAQVTAFDVECLSGVAEAVKETATASQLWDNLQYFLDRVASFAADHGVTLALHPDDPPLPSLRGQSQILSTVAAFDRVMEMSDSSTNGICFCQGTFAETGVDIPKTIRHFGDRIRYVHFRDVVGAVPRFRESFHDNGKTDMWAAVQAYRESGYEGPIRPDHVPTLAGEEAWADFQPEALPEEEITVDTFNGPEGPVSAGYTMLGRLFAVGYMKGLIEAAQALPGAGVSTESVTRTGREARFPAARHRQYPPRARSEEPCPSESKLRSAWAADPYFRELASGDRHPTLQRAHHTIGVKSNPDKTNQTFSGLREVLKRSAAGRHRTTS